MKSTTSSLPAASANLCYSNAAVCHSAVKQNTSRLAHKSEYPLAAHFDSYMFRKGSLFHTVLHSCPTLSHDLTKKEVCHSWTLIFGKHLDSLNGAGIRIVENGFKLEIIRHLSCYFARQFYYGTTFYNFHEKEPPLKMVRSAILSQC